MNIYQSAMASLCAALVGLLILVGVAAYCESATFTTIFGALSLGLTIPIGDVRFLRMDYMRKQGRANFMLIPPQDSP